MMHSGEGFKNIQFLFCFIYNHNKKSLYFLLFSDYCFIVLLKHENKYFVHIILFIILHK